jgi:hypothetical protein
MRIHYVMESGSNVYLDPQKNFRTFLEDYFFIVFFILLPFNTDPDSESGSTFVIESGSNPVTDPDPQP